MSDTFCVLPFFSHESTFSDNKNIFCCRLKPGTDIESVRSSMRNKTRANECSTCWKLEDSNLKSERMIHNATFDYYTNQNIEKIESNALSQGFKTKIVKLATSNLCNSTCITCNSSVSSAWAALENSPIQYNVIPHENLDYLDFNEIVQLSFVGGEPLLEKQNFKILTKLIEANNTNCFISIVTNGSVQLSESQISILKNFSNVNVCISIDGIGPVFEYLRYPLKWERLLESLEQIKLVAKYVSVSSMISNISVFYYSELVNFFNQHQLPFLCKQIDYPNIFAPGNLPDNVKQHVIELNASHKDQVESFLNMGKYSDIKFNSFKNEITRQNELKNIKASQFIPLAANYLNLE